jgi:DNA-binding protein HU-beta
MNALFDGEAKRFLGNSFRWHNPVSFNDKRHFMNKTELIDALAEKTDLSKMAAGRSLDALVEIITETVARGEDVTLVGFGSFKANARAARTGKNPKTGEVLNIAATTVPAFKPGASFKAAVAKKG